MKPENIYTVDIFSDEYMDKINAIQLPNTKIKILQRLLGLLFRLLWELMTEATKRCPLCSPISCSKTDGIVTRSGEKTYWDRATLYALRGMFYSGHQNESG